MMQSDSNPFARFADGAPPYNGPSVTVIDDPAPYGAGCEEEVLPGARPFQVTYDSVLNEWEIVCPEPMSVDHAYTQAKSGRKRWVLVTDAKMWRDKLQAAICSEVKEVEGRLPLNDLLKKANGGLTWNQEQPVTYLFEWYPKRKGRNDVNNRTKLYEDALNGTAIWKDDSQVKSSYTRKIEGAEQSGFIKVTIKPYNEKTCENIRFSFYGDERV